MSANVQVVGHAPRAGDLPRGIGAAALAMVAEVVLGACILVLFLVALACDPIDRKVSARGKRIAEREKRLNKSSVEGAYAILPSD
jgi:hypothetical protein